MKFPAALRRVRGGGQRRLTLAVLLLLAAVGLPPVKVPRDTYNYMVTFDITQSMEVDDVFLDGAPVSRLTLARSAMRDVLRHMPCGSTVGWSIFTDYRSLPLMMPVEVCANYDVLLSSLEKIEGRMRWANASKIDKGIYWALHNVSTRPATGIIFFTDGQEAPPLAGSHSSMPLQPTVEVPGWLIGVGADLPARIPRTDVDGAKSGYWAAEDVVQVTGTAPGASHEHLSELREPYLVSLAGQNGLGYRRLTTPATVTDAVLGRRAAHRAWVPTDVRWVPALMALILLIWIFVPTARGQRSWLSLLPRRLYPLN